MLVAIACVVVACAMTFSFRPAVAGQGIMWAGLLVPYLGLSAVTLVVMHRNDILGERFRARSGDITLGAAIAGVLLGGAWAVKAIFFDDSASGAAWLFRLILQIGAPTGLLVPLGIAAMAIMEELVWRGLVLDALADRFGTRSAWPAATVLYALVHLPTMSTLADPGAGPNPVLPLAALGAGLVWTLAASRIGRLPPVMISHLVFTYFAPALMLPALGRP